MRFSTTCELTTKISARKNSAVGFHCEENNVINAIKTSIQATKNCVLQNLTISFKESFCSPESCSTMLSWDSVRAKRNRFFQRVEREAKVTRLKDVTNEDLHENTRYAGIQTGKKVSKRAGQYELNGLKINNMTRQGKGNDGKKSKSELTTLELSSNLPALIIEQAPSKSSSLLRNNSFKQSCDPAVVSDEPVDDCVPINHVILDASVGNAWEERESHKSIRTALVGLFSRLQREEKTRVKKVRL